MSYLKRKKSKFDTYLKRNNKGSNGPYSEEDTVFEEDIEIEQTQEERLAKEAAEAAKKAEEERLAKEAAEAAKKAGTATVKAKVTLMNGKTKTVSMKIKVK